MLCETRGLINYSVVKKWKAHLVNRKLFIILSFCFEWRSSSVDLLAGAHQNWGKRMLLGSSIDLSEHKLVFSSKARTHILASNAFISALLCLTALSLTRTISLLSREQSRELQKCQRSWFGTRFRVDSSAFFLPGDEYEARDFCLGLRAYPTRACSIKFHNLRHRFAPPSICV